jgi:cytosine/adenosine deaminase-related metal-dependent hydrolase
MGDGIFPAREFLGASGRFGVGTDSNVLIDAAQELRQLEYAARLRHQARNVLAEGGSTGAALFAGALAGGAQALGQPHAGITAGASADILTLAEDHPAFIGRDGDRLLDGWIFAARDGAIDCVWRHGEKVVTAGRHVARDAVGAKFKTVLRGLLA